MSLSAYLRDNLAAIGVGVLCCLGVAGMLAVLGVGVDATVLVPCFVALCGAVVLGLGYVRRRRLLHRARAHRGGRSTARYFASELVEEPGFLEGRLAHEALEAVGKAAADDVAFHRRQAESYRDYIELWIHEIKTPIAAAHLMTADLHGPVALEAEGGAGPHRVPRGAGALLRALHLARARLRHTRAAAGRRRARGLQEERPLPHRARHHPVQSSVADGVTVFADASWLSFVAGAGARERGEVRRNVRASGSPSRDGGYEARAPRAPCSRSPTTARGIPAADVPRVFDRGFTGANGRAQGSATGMGLYLVAAVICEKMGLGVGPRLRGGHRHPRHDLAFPHDRRRRLDDQDA